MIAPGVAGLLFADASMLAKHFGELFDVFGGAFVRFPENDAWYHLRLIENLLHHFPTPLAYDPYLKFPGGQDLNVAPGLDFLVASLALLMGGGAPSPPLVEHVAALVPPVLGAIIILPVYALARSVFSARAGLFAAALIAVLPGQLLARSTLGFTDHHVAEVLFGAVALMLFVWAVDGPPAGTVLRSILAGLGLTSYLAMWSGGALLVAGLTVGTWTHLALDHLRGDRTSRGVLGPFITMTTIAAALVSVLLSNFGFVRYHLVALAGGAASVAIFYALSAWMERAGHRRSWYAAACVVLLIAGIGVLRLAMPGLAESLFAQVSRITSPPAMQVGEATPLFTSASSWFVPLSSSFGLALPLALVALVPTARTALATGRIGPSLLIAWFVVSVAAMVGQVRFAYYVAVPAAILAGFACDRVLDRWPRRQEAAFVLIVLLVFIPNAQLTRAQATRAPQPSDDWYEALVWMREHTPEPFGDANVYFEQYRGMSAARPYPFPPSAYGVLSWWDPGYWILRIARRIPNTNPTQSNMGEAARFFLAASDVAATAILDRLGSRYVIVSSEMPAWMEPATGQATGYVSAMAAAADDDEHRYVETFYERRPDAAPVPRQLYYPDYYRTMLTRLYAYGGRAAVPQGSTYVVTYSEETATSGERRKFIGSLHLVATYDEARRLAERQPGGKSLVVGVDPFRTCVPLDALDTIVSVHRSPTGDSRAPATGHEPRPAVVQIFQYLAGSS